MLKQITRRVVVAVLLGCLWHVEAFATEATEATEATLSPGGLPGQGPSGAVTEPPQPAPAPMIMNPNDILRQLAPGHRRAYGLDEAPSVDLDIRFEIDSAKLSPVSRAQLLALGNALTSPDMAGGRFLIAGHSDATGKAAYNTVLSQRRAVAVVDYLARNFAIKRMDIEVKGYGEDRLKDAANPSSAVNRRVEVRLLQAPPQPKTAQPEPQTETEPGKIDWGAKGGAAREPVPETNAGGVKLKW